ncbi:hypothetical protein Hdeb2414_s0070g00772971 [Helianthus debilis subsp. tardiflorus]
MFYEFGIFRTFYMWKGMPESISCRSEGRSISFIIPSSPKKLRGLNFSCWNWLPLTSYSFSRSTIKISNITKMQTWIYQHYSGYNWVDEEKCYSWLSHWMFGPNEMKAGDNIIIECYIEEDEEEEEERERERKRKKKKMECGVGVVYDDGSMEEEEEEVLSYYKSWNHIIGGDLSAFQLTTGEYYLHNWNFTRNSHEEFYVPFIGNKSSYKGKCGLSV